MKNKSVLLAGMALAMSSASIAQSNDYQLETPLGYGSTGYNYKYATSPIFFPKKHTIESYRSQQRAAKKRRKNKN